MAKAGSEKAKGGGRPAASSHELDNRDEEANGDGRRQKSRRVGNRSASSGPRGAKARQEPRPQLTAEELELERIWNLPVQWDVPDVPRAPQVAPLPDKIDRGRFIRPVAEDLLCDPTGVLDELGFQVDPETLEVTPATLLPGPLRRFIERTIEELWHSQPRGKEPVFARPEPETRPVRSCKLKKVNYRGSPAVDALLREEGIREEKEPRKPQEEKWRRDNSP